MSGIMKGRVNAQYRRTSRASRLGGDRSFASPKKGLWRIWLKDAMPDEEHVPN